MNNLYSKDIKEVFKILKSNQLGLSEEEVKKKLKKDVFNDIKEKPKKSTARVFLDQFQDLLVLILIAAAIISTFIGEIESTIVIFFVITINALLGTYQHFKAEKSLESLKSLSNPIVKVIRNNVEQDTPAREIVIGDIVKIKSGDMIAADGRIFYDNNLEINESSLTGESQQIIKMSEKIENDNLILSNQSNMVFSGTFCTRGTGKYIVTKTGMDTELGKIAKLISEAKTKKTPLQNSLDRFSRFLAIAIIGICILVFILSMYRHIDMLDALMFAVALAVAAIPEALSTIVVIVLAIGTERMANNNAIIKELKAVEGLGCVNVICTDKTGTLTQNKMEVKDSKFYGKEIFFYKALYYSTSGNNPSDRAIAKYCHGKGDFSLGEKLSEIAFTSSRKMMSNLYKINGSNLMFTKGASEIIIAKTKYIKTDTGFRTLEEKDKIKINNEVLALTKQDLRVIAVAYKDLGFQSKINEDDESNLVFVGMVSLVDPLRKESKQAVSDCKMAGIKPVMLTGDHKETALFIAKETGIYNATDLIVSGEELDQ